MFKWLWVKIPRQISVPILMLFGFLGMLSVVLTFAWVFLFSATYIKNSVSFSVPHPMWLADCISQENPDKKKFACRMAWK